MKKFLPFLICLALAACDDNPDNVLSGAFGDFKATYDCMEWQGRQRCYYTVPPEVAPTHIIVALHPAFTPVSITERTAQVAAKAVPRGAVVVYPEGVDKQWNDGRVANETETYRLGTDDKGFLEAVMKSVQAKFALTPAHTSLIGMSNGGMMALKMTCESDLFSRTGTVVANLPKGQGANCPANTKPMLMIFGSGDDVVKFNGGPLADNGKPEEWGEVESAQATIDFFATHNRCQPDFYSTTQNDPEIDTTIVRTRDYICPQAIRTLVVEGMGHTWPGESSRVAAWLTRRGPVSQQIDGTDEILNFLSK